MPVMSRRQPMFARMKRAAVVVWVLITGVIAIRRALDFSTGTAIPMATLGIGG